MSINITIVTYNRLPLTRLCLPSVLTCAPRECTVTLVDNGSTDGTQEYLTGMKRQYANLNLFLLKRNMGVSVAANLGWIATQADYYIKLDNDVVIQSASLVETLVKTLANNPQVAMAGFRLADWADAKEQVTLPDGTGFLSTSMCNGGCVAIPRNIHEEFGFWVEDYGKYGFEDLDYSYRVKDKGYIVGYPETPERAAIHLGFAEGAVYEEQEVKKKIAIETISGGKTKFVLNRFLFQNNIRSHYVERRHLPLLQGDTISFQPNPGYRAIIKIQNELLPKFSFSAQGNTIEVDLSSVKETWGTNPR